MPKLSSREARYIDMRLCQRAALCTIANEMHMSPGSLVRRMKAINMSTGKHGVINGQDRYAMEASKWN